MDEVIQIVGTPRVCICAVSRNKCKEHPLGQSADRI